MVRNPWMKKNPFMSMWMSAANAAIAPARAQAATHVRSQAEAMTREGVKHIGEFWGAVLGMSSPSPSPRPRKRSAGRRK